MPAEEEFADYREVLRDGRVGYGRERKYFVDPYEQGLKNVAKSYMGVEVVPVKVLP